MPVGGAVCRKRNWDMRIRENDDAQSSMRKTKAPRADISGRGAIVHRSYPALCLIFSEGQENVSLSTERRFISCRQRRRERHGMVDDMGISRSSHASTIFCEEARACQARQRCSTSDLRLCLWWLARRTCPSFAWRRAKQTTSVITQVIAPASRLM
jgi:hypothetical protein